MALANATLAHHWAHQTAAAERGSSMLYEGPKLYSYGKHFCIARILPSGKVAFGLHTDSRTTAKHQCYARRAVTHKEVVYCYDPDADAESNRISAEHAVKLAVEHAATPRRIKEMTRLASLRAAQEAAGEFNDYLAALPEDERKGVQPLEVLRFDTEQLERLKQLRREEEAKREDERKKREQSKREAEALDLAKWRLHAFNGYLQYSATALRLSVDGTKIETSKGAEIPVHHAKRLWPYVQNCRGVGMALEGTSMKLGVYTLNEINADGSIRVGCHNISYYELERMAKALGLIEEETL